MKLVHFLLELSKSSKGRSAELAICCLGEIGPMDLKVPVINVSSELPHLSEVLKAFPGDCTMQKYCRIFHLLNDCLVDPR